jgi:hypothetical protein
LSGGGAHPTLGWLVPSAIPARRPARVDSSQLEVDVSYGPIELLVLKFPGNRFSGGVAPALQRLVDAGTIRVIDIEFAYREGDGTLTVLEVNELEDDISGGFDPVVRDVTALLNHDDARALLDGLEPNSSGAVMLFENVWAKEFVDEVVASSGEVVLNARIPREVIDELVAAAGQPEPVA